MNIEQSLKLLHVKVDEIREVYKRLEAKTDPVAQKAVDSPYTIVLFCILLALSGWFGWWLRGL